MDRRMECPYAGKCVGCWVLGAGCYVLCAVCWLLCAGCWVLGAGLGAGCRVLGLGSWVHTPRFWVLALPHAARAQMGRACMHVAKVTEPSKVPKTMHHSVVVFGGRADGVCERRRARRQRRDCAVGLPRHARRKQPPCQRRGRGRSERATDPGPDHSQCRKPAPLSRNGGGGGVVCVCSVCVCVCVCMVCAWVAANPLKSVAARGYTASTQ